MTVRTQYMKIYWEFHYSNKSRVANNKFKLWQSEKSYFFFNQMDVITYIENMNKKNKILSIPHLPISIKY